MKQVDDKADKLILVIGETIRVKKNNYVKKWFSREYRTPKSIKEFAKAGYPEGEYELTVDEFVKIVEDNLTSHRKFVIKKAKKGFSQDVDTIEVGRNTKRDRRKIKAKLIKEGFDLSEKELKKEGGKILVVQKESKNGFDEELLEDDDW